MIGKNYRICHIYMKWQPNTRGRPIIHHSHQHYGEQKTGKDKSSLGKKNVIYHRGNKKDTSAFEKSVSV
jgi:hypothetical protein